MKKTDYLGLAIGIVAMIALIAQFNVSKIKVPDESNMIVIKPTLISTQADIDLLIVDIIYLIVCIVFIISRRIKANAMSRAANDR